VVGHAVEEEQLEEPEPQRRRDRGVQLVDRPRERGDVVVDRAEALDRADLGSTGMPRSGTKLPMAPRPLRV